MCDPTAGAAFAKSVLPSIVVQGAGIALQNRAANKANALQALRMQENRARNKVLLDRQDAAIRSSAEAISADKGKQGIEAAGNELAKILQAALSQRSGTITASDRSAPKVFLDQVAMADAAANARAMEDAKNLAMLDASGKYLAETIAPKVADSAATGQLTGNFVRGNSNVLDTGMRAAGRLAYSPMAQLLQGAGKVGVGYTLYDPDKEE